MAESHRLGLKGVESEHENYLKDHDARHSDILHEVEEKWKQKLAMQLEEKSEDIENQTADFQRQTEKWAEVKRNLEDQLHSVQNELRNQEMAVSAKQKGTIYFFLKFNCTMGQNLCLSDFMEFFEIFSWFL